MLPHFVTGDFKSHATFLDDKTYGVLLDNVVKGCVDHLLVHKSKILLGLRAVYPQKDWWYGSGGRMKPGESPLQSSTRLLSRELGLKLNFAERLKYVGAYSMVWQRRVQKPIDNGTADISVVHTLTLTEQEVANITLDSGEFRSCAWVSADEILEGKYHPCVQRAVGDLVKLWKYQALVKLVERGTQDEEVAVKETNAKKMRSESIEKEKAANIITTTTTSTTATTTRTHSSSSCKTMGGPVSDKDVVQALKAYISFSKRVASKDMYPVQAVGYL